MPHINDLKKLLDGAVAGKVISNIVIRFNKNKDDIILNSINLNDGTSIVLWGNDNGDVCFDLKDVDSE